MSLHRTLFVGVTVLARYRATEVCSGSAMVIVPYAGIAQSTPTHPSARGQIAGASVWNPHSLTPIGATVELKLHLYPAWSPGGAFLDRPRTP
jgi:hypothetical protein